MKPYYFPLFLLIILGASCSQDDDVAPQPYFPSFNIGTSTWVEDSFFVEDTFLIPSRSQADIVFSVLGRKADYDSVAWRIGNDPRRFTSDRFNLTFEAADIGKLDIELTVWPRSIGTLPPDTALVFKKTVQILSEDYQPYAFEGTFRGYNSSDPERIFDVTIVDFGPPNRPYVDSQYWLHVHNLTEGCGGENIDRNALIPSIEMASYSNFYMKSIANTPTNCQEIEGYGKVDPTRDTLTVEYEYRVAGTNEFKNDQFIGNRISK